VPAWGRVGFLRLAPFAKDNRAERIFFFPDPRGVTLRQVQALLAARDPAATDPAALAEKSVVVQGLGALEFVLHGPGADDLGGQAGAHRCAYGRAVADRGRPGGRARLGPRARRALLAPRDRARSDNPLHRTGAEAAKDFLNAAATAVE